MSNKLFIIILNSMYSFGALFILLVISNSHVETFSIPQQQDQQQQQQQQQQGFYRKINFICKQCYCFQGDCPTLNLQCEGIWGDGGVAADRQCYEQFNSKGSINGHCGRDPNGHYIKCEPENVQCGTLQCKEGDRQPRNDGIDQLYSRTIISIKGNEYECKATSGPGGTNEHGLVKDGTPCGNNLICVNQTCVSLFPHIDQTKCPLNKNGQECSNQGVCTNTNRCHCDIGWTGHDCSQPAPVTTTLPAPPNVGPTMDSKIEMKKKETPYENYHGSNTVFLVGILMSVVGFVFVTFTLMALCYRSVVVHRNFSLCLRRKTTRLKYDPPYSKKPIAKAYGGAGTTANHHQSVEEVSLDGSSKLMYGNQTVFRDHKAHNIRRMTGSGSEEDQAHSEKGILKKHGYGLVLGEQLKDKWGEDGQSDNLELIAQQDTLVSATSGAAASEVERTLKSLNGYHEDILEALRNAASHRGTGAGNTPVGSGSLSEEMLRKTLQECTSATLNYSDYKRGSKSSSKENICDINQAHMMVDGGSGIGVGSGGGGGGVGGGLGGSGGLSGQTQLLHHHRPSSQQPQSQHGLQDVEDDAPSTGPLRIRNLEDLIRQLEHHSSRHMSPSGSEDIRMSETEADRHYRLDSSAACSESSQGSNQQLAQSQKTATIHPSYSSRCRPRSDDESRFVYGRYRHPPANRHPHQSHSPHAFGHHTHHSHAHGHPSHGPHSSHHSSHTHLHQDEEGIYESADHHDRTVDARIDRETPDSESDDFIQAQQQLARWASEDVVSVVVLDHQGTSPGQSVQQGQLNINQSGILDPTITQTQQQQQQQSGIAHHHGGETSSLSGMVTTSNHTNGLNVNQRDYYPSPPSTETESSGSVIQPSTIQRRSHIIDTNQEDGQLMENGRYPEYKH